MKHYCKYCIHCIAQDETEAVCEELNIMIKKNFRSGRLQIV